MVPNNSDERLKKYQSEIQKTSVRRHLIERSFVLTVIIFILSLGIYIGGEGVVLPFSFETLRTSVIDSQSRGETVTGLERDVVAPLADRESGVYPKEDLYVGLTFGQAGEIRYSLEKEPTLTSPLYSGYSINVYKPGESMTRLYAVAIDPLGNMSDIAEYTYYFVPDPVENFRAIPEGEGRVELKWDASSDAEIVRYNVYVDNRDPVSAGKYTAYTVSGLAYSEHTFSVSVVDKNGMESNKQTKKILLHDVLDGEDGGFHAAGVEITPDLTADGVVDYQDVQELFMQLPEGVSTRELSILIQCWEKPGCVEEDM